jgi:hypothetical protein
MRSNSTCDAWPAPAATCKGHVPFSCGNQFFFFKVYHLMDWIKLLPDEGNWDLPHKTTIASWFPNWLF